MILRKFMQQAYLVLDAHIIQFAMFGIVGSVTAAIYFLVMWAADYIFGSNYITAVSVAYFVSTAFHFLANKYFTFRAAKEEHVHQIIRYLVMWFVNYLITIVVVSVCVARFLMSPYIGVCISVVFTVFISYALGRYWIFKIRGVV